MRRRTRTLLLMGVTGALMAGGTITAWAAWTTGPITATVTSAAGSIPAPAAPQATLDGAEVVVSWSAITGATPADRYIVSRVTASLSETVCTVTTTQCRDTAVPAGSSVRYRVRAARSLWTGGLSDPSTTVTTPAATAPLAIAAPPPSAKKQSTQIDARPTSTVAPSTEKSPESQPPVVERTTTAPAPVEEQPPAAGPSAPEPVEPSAAATTGSDVPE